VKWIKQKQPIFQAWKGRTPVTDNQFSMISMGDLERANAILATMGVAPYSPKEMRRCIVLDGDCDLNKLRDKTFRIGNVRMRWSQMCTPCGLPGKRAKRNPAEVVAFKKVFGDDSHCLAGIRGSILSTGKIRIGDRLTLE
jgi:MOSC domain-containing protein YiiM